MDSWLEKSHDNGNKRTADDVEAVLKTNARGLLICLRFVRIGYQCHFIIIFSIE